MKSKTDMRVVFEDYLDCFGNFNPEDVVCRKYCAISLRCAIEMEQMLRMELMSDLMQAESVALKPQ